MVMKSPPADDITRERILSAATGYVELGLPDMAWVELDDLSNGDRLHPDVQEFILSLLVRENRWEEAVAAGRPLCTDPATPPAIFIHTAFALHELGQTDQARATLLAGPDSLHSDPLYHYNMACYLAIGGEFQDAEVCLRTAFQMDPKLRVHAQTDPDLHGLQAAL